MINPRGVFFDESLATMVKQALIHFGSEALQQGLFVRDTSGRLTFLNPEPSPPGEKRSLIESSVAAAVKPYARGGHGIRFADEPGVQSLLQDPAAFRLSVESLDVRLLDRRIVGSTWIDRPQEMAALPARIVFASAKGGVGRTTAIVLAAADLARRHKNVLVIDLDLEAPGLGDLLLDDERLPRFGTVDYLVENGLADLPGGQLSEFVGLSSLTTPGGGRVDVLPALGTASLQNPENTLAKLSRALIEDIDAEGDPVPVTVKIARMIDRFTERETYDVVLIDSRAGLSELTAPVILGLGATVLLFGTAQRQTITAFAALFAAFKLLAQRDRDGGRLAEWRLLLKAVHAKASLVESIAARYRDDLYDLFAENLYDAEDVQASPESISFDIDDTNGPHWPLVIPFTQNFVDFDPVRAPAQLGTAFYEQTYRQFLDGLDSLIDYGAKGKEGTRNKA